MIFINSLKDKFSNSIKSKAKGTAFNLNDYEQIPIGRGLEFFLLTTLVSVVIAALTLLISWLVAYCITDLAATNSITMLDRYAEAYASRMSIALIPYVVLGLAATALTCYVFKFVNMAIFKSRNKDGVPNNNKLRIWEWLLFQTILITTILLFYVLFEFAINKFVATIFISNDMNERKLFISAFTNGYFKWMLNPGMLFGSISIISALIVGARLNSVRDQLIAIQEAEETEENERFLTEAEQQAQTMIIDAQEEAQKIITKSLQEAEELKAPKVNKKTN
ncbi:hypothetical protein COT94_03075 [Candidatus Falkowbacteria bacterium CG10_big_fil_rev_8_21_14_0_10_37_14]|uniref:Uncharacterized protein n=1 Tax=Candidatus Falkowbacteria bacterium CG10_big_fil_rev_8_21_14_0_10_37_14 TaxID=1974561 RepID=A0A2M6WT13_9BACT|nr:hypothetical protein [Candidatus Falkowbacteria bacterium]PIT95943.1 MAG: hypothetical protein COT94_03075 [Candidatus Falkowbacteria bacterium CG10_big_fil_rev_8_21_14_0_10_37_14]